MVAASCAGSSGRRVFCGSTVGAPRSRHDPHLALCSQRWAHHGDGRRAASRFCVGADHRRASSAVRSSSLGGKAPRGGAASTRSRSGHRRASWSCTGKRTRKAGCRLGTSAEAARSIGARWRGCCFVLGGSAHRAASARGPSGAGADAASHRQRRVAVALDAVRAARPYFRRGRCRHRLEQLRGLAHPVLVSATTTQQSSYTAQPNLVRLTFLTAATTGYATFDVTQAGGSRG